MYVKKRGYTDKELFPELIGNTVIYVCHIVDEGISQVHLGAARTGALILMVMYKTIPGTFMAMLFALMAIGTVASGLGKRERGGVDVD